MVYISQNSVACAPGNSVVSLVTLRSRSQTASPGTRIRAAHGIAWHVRAWLGRHARLAVHVVHDPGQLS